MHVISRKVLVDFWNRHPKAKAPLAAWHRIVEASSFKTFVEVKQTFNTADYVPRFTIFDVGGNNFRIISVIHYNRKKLYIRHVLTHSEYNRWSKEQRSKS